MRTRRVSLFMLLGIFLPVVMALLPFATASAKTCYNAQQQVIPCPEKKDPTPIDYPSFTPTSTDTPEPAKTPAVTDTPDPAQLALMCTGAGFIPSSGDPVGNTDQSPAPSGSPIAPWLLGGGGLLIGGLIGGTIGRSMTRSEIGKGQHGILSKDAQIESKPSRWS